MNALPSRLRPHGRRHFWQRLLGEVRTLGDEFRGVVLLPLEDLESAPSAVLAEIVPEWRGPSPPFARQDGLYRSGPEPGEERLVHAYRREEERFLAYRIGGGTNLADLAERFRRASPEQDPFPAFRESFIAWCLRGWCQPAAEHRLADPATVPESEPHPP